MSTIGSTDIPSDLEDWLDIGESGSVASLSLDQVLNDVENIDENLSFLDGSDECSLYGASSGSPLPPSIFTYEANATLSAHRIDSVSHQIRSLAEKGGSPTAISQNNGRIVIGTSKGMLLLFDETGHLDRFVNCTDELGSVSSLTFAPGGKFVAVGYSKGAVKIISTRTGSVVHIVREAVQPGRGVIQVIYFGRVHSFLTLDSGGNVFEVRLKSSLIMGKGEQIRCVFSGCNGEVVAMKCLPHQLLAMLTVSKAMLVSTRFGGAVLCAIPLKGHSEYPPLLDFRDQGKGIITLCVARGDKLSIFPQVYCTRLGSKQKAMTQPKCIQLPHPVVAANFVSDHGIAVFDVAGHILFVDSERGTINKALTYQLELVFSTSDYKGLTTGGNVSAALKCMAETTCYQSVAKYDNGITVLTHNGVFKIEKVGELDQVEIYRERSDHVSSCLYLCDLITGRVHCSHAFKKDIQNILIAELRSLLLLVTDGCKAGRITDLVTHYRKHITIIINVCVSSGQFEFLYEDVWSRVECDELSRSVFLDSLDEYVLDEKLPDVSPSIASAYISHLASEGHFSEMQSAIVHFPIHAIDLHYVMSTCRQNGLYDGIIYIMNKALFDYLSPLEEMLELVSQFASHDVKSDTEVEHGNRLLLYIHCCLAGHAYPFGTLPNSVKNTVPIEVYRCITSLKGKDGSSSNKDYPYLRLLLLFDAQQFIHVISTCCDSPLFQVEGRLQRLTEMLGLLANQLLTEAVLMYFLSLVVRLLESNLIIAHVEIIEECVSNLLRMASQNAVAEAFVVDTMRAIPSLNRSAILRLARSPMRSSVCSYIYLSERRYVDLITCYLADERTHSTQLFPALRSILSSEITREEKATIIQFIEVNVTKLTDISALECAQLLVDFIPEYFSQLVSHDPVVRVQNARLLQPAFQIRRDREEQSLTGDEKTDQSLFEIVFEAVINQSNNNIVDRSLEDLLSYWLPLGSLTDYCLNKASEKSCINSVIMLLEARHLVDRAFEEIFNLLNSSHGEEETLCCLDRALTFCSRHSHLDRQKEWLMKVFETVIKTSINFSGKEFDSQIESLTMRIIASGSQHSHSIFNCLLQYPSFAAGSHGQYSSLINSMLSACSFETTMLSSIQKCMDFETSSSLVGSTALSSRSVTYKPVEPFCSICHCALTKAAFIFSCGHVVHMDCDDGLRACPCERQKRGVGKKHNFQRLLPRTAVLNNLPQKRNIFVDWDKPLNLCPSS